MDKVTFNETEHLLVSLPLESVIEGVYLRGYVGSVYTGDGWENHSRATRNEYDDLKKQLTLSGFEPAIGSSYILDKKPYNSYTKLGRVWVTYRDIPNDYVYAPYFASFDKEYEIEFDYDLSAISSKNKEYVFDYRYNLSDVIEMEKLYSYDNNLKEYYGQEFKYRQLFMMYILNFLKKALID